ncbi:MAG: hypothetical protein AAF720_00955 [Pseudomonadota bacterium]
MVHFFAACAAVFGVGVYGYEVDDRRLQRQVATTQLYLDCRNADQLVADDDVERKLMIASLVKFDEHAEALRNFTHSPLELTIEERKNHPEQKKAKQLFDEYVALLHRSLEAGKTRSAQRDIITYCKSVFGAEFSSVIKDITQTDDK